MDNLFSIPIDYKFLESVESMMEITDSDKFRKNIVAHAENSIADKFGFGIDSNPILGKAIRLYFDKVNRKKKITYRSIYDKWEPTCYHLD